MVILSPHLDDAVLSCAGLMARHPQSTVVTVFAGLPDVATALTDWDARCGFDSSRAAMLMRRAEDERALALLQARPMWLDFMDAQYGSGPTPQVLGEALLDTLHRLASPPVVLPMGLFHSDHRLAHEAGLWALRRVRLDWSVLLYEDVPYRSFEGLLQQRLHGLAQAGLVATPSDLSDGTLCGAKAQAVKAYDSQLRGLGPRGRADIERPERLWNLVGACGGGHDA